MARFLIFFVLVCFVMVSGFAQLGTQEMYIKVNGNSYTAYDLFADTLRGLYCANNSEIQNILKEKIRGACAGYRIKGDIVFEDWPSEITSIDYSKVDDTLEVCITIYPVTIMWKINHWLCGDITCRLQGEGAGTPGKITIRGKIASYQYGDQIKLLIKDVQSKAELYFHHWFDKGFCRDLEWFNIDLIHDEEITKSMNQYSITSLFPDKEYELFGLFTEFGNITISPEQANEILSSLPFVLSLDADANHKLVIKCDIMPGGSEPPAVASPSYEYIGFACPYYAFQTLKNLPGITTVLQQEKFLIDTMAHFGAQAIRFALPWREVASAMNIDPNNTQDPDNLTGQELENAVNALAKASNVWANTDTIISMAFARKLDVIPQLLQQEADLPRIDNGTINPDYTLRGLYPDPNNAGKYYYYVSPNAFLRYAKIFAHAAVRRYRDKIGIWAIESELNAARIASFVKWPGRLGNCWQDVGFQEKLWRILVEAVRNNDPTARLTSTLHIINLEDGINRFGKDLDIIGINVYPNQIAYPVMGYMVGELVRATRRVLYNKGWTNKEIHVTETSYPGVDPDETASDGNSVKECLSKYSFYRQKKYIADAITSAVNAGAKGFFWWGFLDSEDNPAQFGESDVSNYGSLIRLGTNPIVFKPAATEFKTKVPTVHPLKADVLLKNVALTTGQDLGGKISLYGQRDNLNSGSTVPALRNRYHISKTEQQYLNGLKHKLWDNDVQQYKMKEQFLVESSISYKERFAKFATYNPVIISAQLIDDGNPGGVIEFKDPWYVADATGSQPNQFIKHNSPHSPTGAYNQSTGGVFLNQTPDPHNPNAPYYSVRAPQEQMIGSYKG